MNLKQIFLPAFSAIFLFSCVSTKKFKAVTESYDSLNGKYLLLQGDNQKCNNDKGNLQRQLSQSEMDKAQRDREIADLNKQVDFLKQNNNQSLKQLQDMSVITASQAESIRKSMDNMGSKDNYIQTLQQQLAHKDSMNMALVMNLKGALGNINDQDINIKVEKGVVYIDISDKLLFKSGKYDVTDQAKEVLGKVATVLKGQPDIEFMVEGHTDNVPYKGGGMMLDNWDLSVKRATSVVRILQDQYGLDPSKITAAGRSEYAPVGDNDTAENRAANRRTRIVILPQLDQFFKLLEPKK